jgi:gliding motility-associated-like protein
MAFFVRIDCSKIMRSRWLISVALLWTVSVPTSTIVAQSDNPYHHNGAAYQENCHCFTLTPEENNQSGSVWNVNKIDLRQPFDFNFNVNLGCKDANGADGIVFVLQPINTSVGGVGQGLGYTSISPSIGVEIDTWINPDEHDPIFDHISISRNGSVDHESVDNSIAMPVLPDSGNIEDCQWHSFRVTWDPAIHRINAEIDGVYRTGFTFNIVRDVFGNDPMVFWGFTSATGQFNNHQRVCTSLDAKFELPEGQNTCFPQTLTFSDSSKSFGSIVKWNWDFGDGTTYESQTPPPHNYSAPGKYDVQLTILGNDGCLSDPFIKTIVMGSKPVAGFTHEPSVVCENLPLQFKDISEVQFGTISKWRWMIGNQTFSAQKPPLVTINGAQTAQLSVETAEGCVSSNISESLTAKPSPVVAFDLRDICLSDPLLLEGASTGVIDVQKWSWTFGDGNTHTDLNARTTYKYHDAGNYNVWLTGYSNEGCPSPTVKRNVNVYKTDAHAGADTILAIDQPSLLNASGGDFYKWSPAEGLSADNISNPVVTLDHNQQYILTAYTEAGCATTDTLNIKVYKGPAIYVPSAFSPNGDGKNDRFQFIAVGMKSVQLFQVFNRYGQVVYSSPAIEGWDGRMAGRDMEPGTYVWMISGIDLNGAVHSKKGTVTLVR